MRDLFLATGLLACAFVSLFAMPAQAATFEVLQFSLIDLGTEGRAKLVLDHWEYEVPAQDWPYTISEGHSVHHDGQAVLPLASGRGGAVYTSV